MPTAARRKPHDANRVTGALSKREEKDVAERRPPRAAVVFEAIRQEGDEELERPFVSLACSGLAAGLSMGFSLVATGVLQAYVPAAPWQPLVVNLGYTIGFLIVILGRQQLFTENTVTVILPLLDSPNRLRTLGKVGRLWAIVLGANLIGAGAFAFALAHTSAFDAQMNDAFLAVARKAVDAGAQTLLVRGIFAGWLIALMVWLLPAADQTRPFVIMLVTYVVGAAGLSHIIAGSIEALYLVALGKLAFGTYVAGFALPTFAGNVIGGVALVALLNYGQVAAEKKPANAPA